jgi:hypothetical protein
MSRSFRCPRRGRSTSTEPFNEEAFRRTYEFNIPGEALSTPIQTFLVNIDFCSVALLVLLGAIANSQNKTVNTDEDVIP